MKTGKLKIWIVIMVMLFDGYIFLVGPIREAKNIYLFIYYGIFAAFFVSVFIIAGCILRKVKKFCDEENDNRKALGSDNIEFKGIAQPVWNAYGATFKNKINDVNKTRANADLYFNTDSVMSELFPNFSVMKWFGLVPETFVGLGILGTFLGFSVGMGNIDFSDSAKMIENVQHLVSSGFATAFNTSIVGIFCSMIYKFFIYNPLFYELDSHFRKLSDELDKEYFVNDSEILVEQVAEQTKAINDMGTTITELFTGELKNIINNFTEVLEEQIGKQTDAMKNMNNELTKLFSQEVRSIINDFAARMDAQIAKQTSVLDSFNNNVSKQLAQDIKDVLDEALKGIGEILRSAFIENIHNEVESMKASLIDVITELNTVADNLAQTPENLEESNKKIIDGFTHQLGRFSEFSDSFFEKANVIKVKFAGIVNTANDIWEQLSEMAELAPAALDKFNKQLNDELSGRFQEFEKLAAGYKQISDDVFNISKQINKYIPVIIGDTNKMINSTGKMQERVNDLVARVERTCESLESQEKVNSARVDSSVKEFDRTCAELKPILEHMGEIEKGFGELDKNLAGTFNKINSGMKEYMNHVDDTFKKIAEKASEYKK